MPQADHTRHHRPTGGDLSSITPTVGRRMSGRSPALHASKPGPPFMARQARPLEVQIDGALHHLKDRFGLNALFPHPRLTLMRFPRGAFDSQTNGDVHRSTGVSPRTEVVRRGRASGQGSRPSAGHPSLACASGRSSSSSGVPLSRSCGAPATMRPATPEASCHRGLDRTSEVKRRCLRDLQAPDLLEEPLSRTSVPEVDLAR